MELLERSHALAGSYRLSKSLPIDSTQAAYHLDWFILFVIQTFETQTFNPDLVYEYLEFKKPRILSRKRLAHF